MKDGIIAGIAGIASITACYGLYLWRNPAGDGVVFASIVAALAALGGYTIASAQKGE